LVNPVNDSTIFVMPDLRMLKRSDIHIRRSMLDVQRSMFNLYPILWMELTAACYRGRPPKRGEKEGGGKRNVQHRTFNVQRRMNGKKTSGFQVSGVRKRGGMRD
jgi:hypothetical protein